MNIASLYSAFNWYGTIIGCGMALCIVLAYFSAKKRGYYKDIVFDIAIICIPLAIIGARLYYVVFDIIGNGGSWTFLRIIGVEGGGLSGLAIYGGLIFASLGGVIIHFWKRNKKPESQSVNLAQLLDLGFTFIILGQCIGRWGNFANQEAYGPKVDFSFFPITVYIDSLHATDGAGNYLATFFYESMWNLAGFILLFWLYNGKRKSFDGFVFSVYCIYEGIGRAWIEQLRKDSLYLGPIRISQLISFIMIIFGIIWIVMHLYRARERGLKPFIFVPENLLDKSYYNYTKSILHHPNVYEKKPKDDKDDEFYDNYDGGFKNQNENSGETDDENADSDDSFYDAPAEIPLNDIISKDKDGDS